MLWSLNMFSGDLRKFLGKKLNLKHIIQSNQSKNQKIMVQNSS